MRCLTIPIAAFITLCLLACVFGVLFLHAYS
jgi:hypothetical protein